MSGYLNKSNGSQAQWRRIIISNIAGALVSVLAAYFVVRAEDGGQFYSSHLPYLGSIFLVALGSV